MKQLLPIILVSTLLLWACDERDPAETLPDGPLADGVVDISTDRSSPDMASPDLASPDVASPDLAAPDLVVPDLPAPTCTDKVKNGNETDVDCGGGTCVKCADTKGCAKASDCQSGVCTAGKCQAPSCTDKVKNGKETDTDCGGACSGCATGKTCKKATDCASSYCSKGQCASYPANCKQVLALNSTAPSGTYKVDPDGPGGKSPFSVYCDNVTAGGGWTVFMFVSAPLKSANTTLSVIDPTKLKGYYYMTHARFTALAKAGMKVRAWGIHNPQLYLECGFESAGANYKSWKATLSCQQRIGLVAGGYKLLPSPSGSKGFVYHSAYDAINPGNVITANSVFTKIHNNAYSTGWDMPGTPGDNWVSGGYKWYYGDWVTSATYAMIYALR